MTEEELIRKLNSVGKAVFVHCYHIFKACANCKISSEECVETLVKIGVSNESGAKIRCGNAKLIFQANKQINALEIIIASKRLSAETINKAKDYAV